MRRILFLLSISTLVVLLGSHAPACAAVTTPQVLAQIALDDSTNNKFPSIATYNQNVYIGGSVSKNGTSNNTDAMLWTLAEEGTSIGSGVSVGGSYGKPDYSTTAVATGPDGSVYVFWGSISEQNLYIRRCDASGNWGATYTVTSGSFPIFQQVAVDSTGKVYVVWQGVNIALSFKYSTNQGASWSSTYNTSHSVYSVPPTISIGPSNEVVVGLTTSNLSTGVAIWTGSSLSSEILTGDGIAANTSVSVGPDGKIYAAWRGIDEGSGTLSGAHFAERQSANVWNQSQLVSGNVKGTVNIQVDSTATVHIGWISLVSGSLRFHYSYRIYGEQFSTAGSSSALGIFNSRMAMSSNGAFVHAAVEDFSVGSPRIVYLRFSGSGSSFTATPVIADDAAYLGSAATTQVKFISTNGLNVATTQVRWHWNSAPTDSDTWHTYTNPITVDVPASLRTTSTCETSTLYTQLRDTQRGTLESPAKKDTVIIDGVLQGTTEVHNPYINITSSTNSLDSELTLSKGAYGTGDPNYTRLAVVYLSAEDRSDCSGIASVSIGKTANSMEATYKPTNGMYSGFVPLPDLANLQTGAWPVVVKLADTAGNTSTQTYNMIFDDIAPVLGASTPLPTASPNAHGDILQDLTFTNVNVTDNLYSNNGRQFWGVWLANSTELISEPATSSALNWIAIPTPGTGNQFTIKNWSLVSGLSSTPTAGQLTHYYIYVRFLDGAGNPTAPLSAPIEVSSYSQHVPSYMPLVIR